MQRVLVMFLVVFPPIAALGVELRDVSHSPPMFDPVRDQKSRVTFELSAPAMVALEIYDGRDLRVRRIEAGSEPLPVGRHALAWDGRDQEGDRVPHGAYIYVLSATAQGGSALRWDPTDVAGKPVEVADLHWDPESGQLSYQLAHSARVRIRIGLDNGGPLLCTPLDWVARRAGSHQEPWDGRDASGSFDLARHPALAMEGEAFSLPPNTILVGPPAMQVAFPEVEPGSPRRPAQESPPPHRMHDFARQSADARADFVVSLTLPETLEQTEDGYPIVAGPAAVSVELDRANLMQQLNQRSEAVFYVDGSFAFERETGFLPLTWRWDPRGHREGLHYLTVNLRGYEGSFGTGTIAVWVQPTAERVED